MSGLDWTRESTSARKARRRPARAPTRRRVPAEEILRRGRELRVEYCLLSGLIGKADANGEHAYARQLHAAMASNVELRHELEAAAPRRPRPASLPSMPQ
jgi:hypothetical protein